MVRKEVIEYCPDYLKDFKEVQAISDAARFAFAYAESKVWRSASQASTYSESEMWRNVFKMSTGQKWADGIKILIKRYVTITEEEYTKIVGAWLGATRCKVTMDLENLSVVVQTTRGKNDVNGYSEMLRDVFPCNMTVEIQYVSELK